MGALAPPWWGVIALVGITILRFHFTMGRRGGIITLRGEVIALGGITFHLTLRRGVIACAALCEVVIAQVACAALGGDATPGQSHLLLHTPGGPSQFSDSHLLEFSPSTDEQTRIPLRGSAP